MTSMRIWKNKLEKAVSRNGIHSPSSIAEQRASRKHRSYRLARSAVKRHLDHGSAIMKRGIGTKAADEKSVTRTCDCHETRSGLKFTPSPRDSGERVGVRGSDCGPGRDVYSPGKAHGGCPSRLADF